MMPLLSAIWVREKEELAAENGSLSAEVADVSERLEWYESVLVMDEDAQPSDKAATMHTASTAVMVEVKLT